MVTKKDRRSYMTIDEEDGSPSTQQSVVAAPSTSYNSVVAPYSIVEPPSAPPLQHLAASTNPTAANGNSHSQHGSQHSSWEHVPNLDQFFTLIYEYHQGGGWSCIVADRCLSLLQFVFIVLFASFFVECLDYDVLFLNKNVTASGDVMPMKRRFSDAIVDSCPANAPWPFWIVLICAFVFWLSRLARTCYYLIRMNEISRFYKFGLGIDDDTLVSTTWHAVLQKLISEQSRLSLSVEPFTQFDVYHRVLRQRNYFVALVNKDILPPVLNVPFIGDVVYFPNGLRINLEMLLSWGVALPWKSHYELRPEYKNRATLPFVIEELERNITWMALANLICSPLLFVYQLLYSVFTLGELVKREPGAVAVRKYSNYARLRLRHFNELDHELNARLNRSHLFATEYMNQFFSPVGAILARRFAFVAGALFIALTVLGAWDEDVLTIEHAVTVLAVSGLTIYAAKALVPDEHLVFQPDRLMQRILSEIHYGGSNWTEEAHTEAVRIAFSQLFQLRIVYLLHELFSALLTPFILYFWVRPRATQIVEFIHEFSVDAPGLGDVCSFAKLDVADHGDPNWHNVDAHAEIIEDKPPTKDASPTSSSSSNEQSVDPYYKAVRTAHDGKIELSALHFAATNPEWQPPKSTADFVEKFRRKVQSPLWTDTAPGGPIVTAGAAWGAARGGSLADSVHTLPPASLQLLSMLGPARPARRAPARTFDGPLMSEDMDPVMVQSGAGLPAGANTQSSVLGADLNASSMVNSIRVSLVDRSAVLSPPIWASRNQAAHSAALDMSAHVLALRQLHADGMRTATAYDSMAIWNVPGGTGESASLTRGPAAAAAANLGQSTRMPSYGGVAPRQQQGGNQDDGDERPPALMSV